jgi:hypothetical protein
MALFAFDDRSILTLCAIRLAIISINRRAHQKLAVIRLGGQYADGVAFFYVDG